MIRETGVRDNAFLILGLRRPGRTFIGTPKRDETIAAGDTLILYGQADALKRLTGPECGAEEGADLAPLLREEAEAPGLDGVEAAGLREKTPA
jgi:hypothetical protein